MREREKDQDGVLDERKKTSGGRRVWMERSEEELKDRLKHVNYSDTPWVQVYEVFLNAGDESVFKCLLKAFVLK